MAQGAHKGRPVAAALCTPGLRPPKSPLRGAFDLSRQAAGRAEAASVQITALSPHPCGLPRPAGNVSAILRPPTPAVSASAVNKLKAGRTNRRSGKALAATRQKKRGSKSVGWMKGSITAAGLRNRQPQLPDSHRVVGAVVISGDSVEVRQTIPVLVPGADIQPQQAGLLMVAQRLRWG